MYNILFVDPTTTNLVTAELFDFTDKFDKLILDTNCA
jgi:hypothetical protein